MAVPYNTLIKPVVARLAAEFRIAGGEPAEALLIAIGLQESGFATRDQIDAGPQVIGPATGFWQFERGGGVRGVLRHPASRAPARLLTMETGTAVEEDAVWRLFATPQGDELACAFARLLLFTDPVALPAPVPAAEEEAWLCYLRNWRPGKPRREHWGPFWRDACNRVAGSGAPAPVAGVAPSTDLAALADRVAQLEAAANAAPPTGPAPADRIPTGDDAFRVPFVLLDAFERAGELAEKVAAPLAGLAPAAVTIDFGPNARAADVTDFSRKVLEDIMRAAGLTQVVVSSTARGPADQARVMFNNLEARGVAKEKELYGPAGDQVIDTYDAAKRAGQDAAAIKRLMTEKIIEIGPTRVSRHASDPRVLNVFDVAPSSVARPAAFEAAVRSNQRVSRFFKPPEDPGYHLEIPQPPTV
ncbi:hypothetical protein SAMN04487779_100436 [Belnapia rosea]|uniref:Uncharacterized protein n=1 Tax=Belnapia rosea TaxID=938405 RepID=A0A1G6RLB9_9PROT|nr:hypothetical protein SAMN04487779_100436 [Belnapia rosea]